MDSAFYKKKRKETDDKCTIQQINWIEQMCRWYCKYQKVGQAWMRGKADDCMNQHSVCWLLDLLIGLWKHGTPQGRFSVFVLLWRNEQRKRWCMKAKIIWGGRSTGSRRNSAPSRFASVNSHTSSWTSPSRWAIIVIQQMRHCLRSAQLPSFSYWGDLCTFVWCSARRN